MAASDLHPRTDLLPPGGIAVPTPLELLQRLDEEIGRAERYGTQLSCLLVLIENLDELTREHGSALREQALAYAAGALRRDLRRFDRIGRAPEGDLLIILPGADSARGEVVARRALERLRTIKVEAGGTRRALQISVGLAAWRESDSAEALLENALGALRSANEDESSENLENAAPPALRPAEAAGE